MLNDFLFDDLSQDDAFDELGMNLDVPFVPSHETVVKAMLELAAVDSDDILYDLGAGDGRIAVAAALDYGARAVGVEIDGGRVALANAYAEQMGVEHRACFIQDNLFEVDFSPATVVTLYLLHTVNLELRPRLLSELRPGARIVSQIFDLGTWRPDRRVAFGRDHLYLWIVPAPVAGSWRWQSPDGDHYRAELRQDFQKVDGELWINEQKTTLRNIQLWGDLLELTVDGQPGDAPPSIVMHCQTEQLTVVSEYQRGAIARRG